jgi:PAS domain S-box-containing protein
MLPRPTRRTDSSHRLGGKIFQALQSCAIKHPREANVPTTQQPGHPAKATLEQVIAQHRAILAAALDPIVTIDFNGIIQSASDSVQRVFGWTPAEVVGRNISMLMPEPHHSAHDGYLAKYHHTHQTNILGRTREFHAVRKDGSLFPIELSVSRVDIPGASDPWFMGIIHDITERKNIDEELDRHRAHLQEMVQERTAQLEMTHEQLRQADRLTSIGTLAAGLGHDMNNVLLPIRARLDALDAADVSPAVREHFKAVQRSVAYLQQLTDGLHLLALDPEDAEASTSSTSIAEWWKQVGPLLTKAVPRRILFAVDLPADLPEIALPPHRLTQAVLNLVVNAGEAMPGEGRVTIWARTGIATSLAQPEVAQDHAVYQGFREVVQLGVTDTGEGMSQEVKKHALDPFFTTKKRGLGTGLGLSLVRGVAQSAGGSVEIDSEVGRGTTVKLNLPALTQQPAGADGTAPGQGAVISIRDRRAATLIAAILQPAMTVRMASGLDPGPSRLWIIESGAVSVSVAKRYLRSDRRRRIVLFGPASDEWMALGVMAIEDPTNLELIRSTLRAALTALVSAAT